MDRVSRVRRWRRWVSCATGVVLLIAALGLMLSAHQVWAVIGDASTWQSIADAANQWGNWSD